MLKVKKKGTIAAKTWVIVIPASFEKKGIRKILIRYKPRNKFDEIKATRMAENKPFTVIQLLGIAQSRADDSVNRSIEQKANIPGITG